MLESALESKEASQGACLCIVAVGDSAKIYECIWRIMKTNNLFAAGVFLPLFLAGIAEASICPDTLGSSSSVITITPKSKELDAISYGKPLPAVTDPNYFSTHVLTIKIPTYYELDSIECSIKRPGETPEFSKAACGKIEGTGTIGTLTRKFKELHVQQGLNEFQVKVTAKLKDLYKKKGCAPGELSSIFKSSWFVHTQNPDAPTPKYRNGDTILAIPGVDGTCTPVVVSINVEHQATIHYQVNNGPTQTAQAPTWPLLPPPGYVDFDLVLENVSLAAAQSLELTLWVADHIRGATSTPVQWFVHCPSSAFAIIVPPFPPKNSYLSEATFHLSTVGSGVGIELRCSCPNEPFSPCQSSTSHTCSNLQAGDNIFRVYAEVTPGIVDEYRWTVSAPDVNFLSMPGDSTETTAIFEFETVSENGLPVPADFYCRVDGGSFFRCTSPFSIDDLVVGEHSLEVYAQNSLGAGTYAQHTWEVLEKPAPSKDKTKDKDTDKDKDKDKADKACSAAGGLPLSFAALLGLWATRRRRS